MSLDLEPDHEAGEVLGRYEATMVAFYRATGPELVRYLQKIASGHRLPDSRVDAENVAYEAIARTLEKWANVENPRAYAFQVAKNLIAKARVDLRVMDDNPLAAGEAAERSESSGDPLQRLLDDELIGLFNRLPSKQRAATYLRHIEKVPSAYIARELNCQPATVDVHVHRGVAALRRMAKILAAAGSVVAAAFGFRALLGKANSVPGEHFPKGPWDLVGSGAGLDTMTLLMVIVGALLVALGIGSIVLLLVRRNRDDDDDDDDDPRRSHPRA